MGRKRKNDCLAASTDQATPIKVARLNGCENRIEIVEPYGPEEEAEAIEPSLPEGKIEVTQSNSHEEDSQAVEPNGPKEDIEASGPNLAEEQTEAIQKNDRQEEVKIAQLTEKVKFSTNDDSELALAKINLSTDFVEWDGILVSQEGSYQ